MSTIPASSRASDKSLTPMMRQYWTIKEQNPDIVLLYRLGDFYEMFHEDAKIASKVLGLTLTSRNHGSADATPLAGFPHHAIDRYATRLVKAGYKIAICEQTEDPKNVKGIVKREIVEIISAGTATDDTLLEDKANNYIVALWGGAPLFGLAVCDISTGAFFAAELDAGQLLIELERVSPSEVLISDVQETQCRAIIDKCEIRMVTSVAPGYTFEFETAHEALCSHFDLATLDGLGFEGYGVGISAAGALLAYVKHQKRNQLAHIGTMTPLGLTAFAELDPSTIRNLELLRPLHADDTGATLVWVLDKCATSMGARLLKRHITRPLVDCGAINQRLDCIEWFKADVFVRGEIALHLGRIADIERLIGKIVTERANARDCRALKESLGTFPAICKTLAACDRTQIIKACSALQSFVSLVEEIEKTIVDAPPLSIRDGGLIRSGVSEKLDELKKASTHGKEWIASLQQSERVRSGIGSLKIGYTRVFGYYIEISNANKDTIPQNYIRKQTLAGAERYITAELKEMEDTILHAEERFTALETEIFITLRKHIAAQCAAIQTAAGAIAQLDVMVGLARVAAEYNYVRPVLTQENTLIIKDGRHPVIERMIDNEQFIPNDTSLRAEEHQILLITGPNMAGKSTYLRQNALIALMAQMGSFVPAAEAHIGIVDRFFTRVGASDRLARGQSTFLVEMVEVANILNNATDRSLVLLDEVGRGTSTFDGLSIAWAVAEFLHETPGRRARTFFATHYHELAEMSLLFGRIRNLHIKIREWNDKIIFLRKIDEGACDHSYGIAVARLAGVPQVVLARAREILTNLEAMELTPDRKPALAVHLNPKATKEVVQIDLFAKRAQSDPRTQAALDFLGALESLDLNTMTPMAALEKLSSIQQALKVRGSL